MKNKPKEIAILGGGISGLAAAWHLKQRFQEQINITIIEKSDHFGGWISTKQKNGFLFEQGPRGCRPKGSGLATLELVEQLGLQNELIASDPSAKRRFLWSKEHLHEIPTSFSQLFTSQIMRRALVGIAKDLFCSKSSKEDESIENFCMRQFGPFVTQHLVDPMVLGIYAGDIGTLSMRSCFPKLYAAAQKHSSVIKGLLLEKENALVETVHFSAKSQAILASPLFSFRSGMSVLTDRIADKIAAYKMLSSEVQQIICKKDKLDVVLPEQTLSFDHVIAAIPAQALANLLKSEHRSIHDLLHNIESASVAVVQLGYHSATLQSKQKGFGYLIPRNEQEALLGVVFDSCIFPEQNGENPNQTRLTAMLRLSSSSPDFDKEYALQQTLQGIQKHLRISHKPDHADVFFATDAIPQYIVGHSDKLSCIEQQLKEQLPQLQILGNSYYGVSVNDCIAHARKLASYLVF